MPRLVRHQFFVRSASSQRVSVVVKTKVTLWRYWFIKATLWRALVVRRPSSYTRNNDNNRPSCDDQTDRESVNCPLDRQTYTIWMTDRQTDSCSIVDSRRRRQTVNCNIAPLDRRAQADSGYVLSNIIRLSMILPLGGGSSYIPTPKSIVRKRVVVNVKSYGMDCFLSALYPVRRNANQLSSYVRHRDTIDCSELLFPLHPSQIKIFERNNPTIAIHCLALNDKKTRIPSSICRQTCIDAPTRFRCYY